MLRDGVDVAYHVVPSGTSGTIILPSVEELDAGISMTALALAYASRDIQSGDPNAIIAGQRLTAEANNHREWLAGLRKNYDILVRMGVR